MKQFITICGIIMFANLAGFVSRAQYVSNVDSLLHVLETQAKLTDADKLKIYKSVMESTGNSRILTKCISEGMPLAKKLHDKSKESMFNEYKSRIYVAKAQFDSALICLDRALELALASKDKWQITSIYTSYGVVYGNTSQYGKLIETQLKALKIAEEMDDKQTISASLMNIGAAYSALNDNERSIEYLERALAMAEETALSNNIAHVHYQLGAAYYGLKNYEKTEEHLLLAHKLIQQVHSSYAMQSYISIGLSELYAKGIIDMEKAESYGKQGLDIALSIHNPQITANAYSGMAHIYHVQGHYKECDSAATRAWQLDSTNFDIAQSVLPNIVFANIKLGNNKKALLFFEKYYEQMLAYNKKSMHDSYNEQEVKYGTEKKESRISALEKELARYVWMGFGTMVILFLTIVLFIVRQIAQRRKLRIIAIQAALDAETAERSRIGRDLHDRLGGMLSAVKMNLDSRERIQHVREMLDSAITELRRVSHNLIPETLWREGLKAALEDFCCMLPNVKFRFFGEEKRINERLETLAYICVFELVNNALKHAEAENITIELVQSDRRVQLLVQDNGRGFNPQSAGGGIGLHNLRARVTAFGGSMDITSSEGKGTEINVNLEL